MGSFLVMFGHSLPIALQLAVILLTSAGWGYWLYRWVEKGPIRRPDDFLLCGVAGGCACWIFLQDLACLGMRLAWSAWLGAAIAVLGLAGLERRMTAKNTAGARSSAAGGWLAPAGVVLLVFGFQASGVVYWGRTDYYGYGRQDQLTYVEIAQFLIEKPFATEYRDVGLHPWMVKAIDMKRWRIGQSVADGYLAVITGTDSQGAYGTTSVFFVVLLSVSVLVLLRSLGAGEWLAVLGAVWAGVLPAVTQDHLDGFLPQVSTLFCLPALVLAVRVAGRNLRLGLVSTSVVLSFLFGSYCEIYPIGLALVIGLSGVALPFRLRARGLFALACLALSLALLLPACADYVRLIAAEYHTANDPNILKEWGPRVGTWRGWSEIFFIGPAHDALLVRAEIMGGFAMLGFIGMGLFSRSLSRRAELIVMIWVPASVLGLLLSAAQFPKYAFGKLLICFASLGVVSAILGIRRLGQGAFAPLALDGVRSPRVLPVPAARYSAVVCAATLTVLAGWASWSKLQVVFANGAGLPTMNSPEARAVYRELDAHPERRYLLTEPHYILNGWFCYHARHSDFYSAMAQIGDRPMAADFLFRQPPPKAGEIWTVANGGVEPLR